MSFFRAVFVSLLLCACAPQNLPYRPPPAAQGEHHAIRDFPGKHGLTLFAQSWRPVGTPRAVFIIMHGLKDHSSRYDGFARRLTMAGYAVYAMDLRGHGRSAGRRVDVAAFADYVDDLAAFVADVRQREQQTPAIPVFVFGHSMGGAIVGLLAEQHGAELAGVILSGPALALDLPPEMIASAALLARVAPNTPALRLSDDDFSRDPAATAELKADALIAHDAGPAHTAAELTSAISTFWAELDSFKAPALILHGTGDRLTSPYGSAALAERLGSRATLRLYDGFFHDLLHEAEHARVEADILQWLDSQNGGERATTTATPPATLRSKWPQVGTITTGLFYEHGLDQGAGLERLGAVSVTFEKQIGLWAGAFDGFIGGSNDGFAFAAEVHPLGVGGASTRGRVALTGGAGVGRFGDNVEVAFQFPVRAIAEADLGPVRATAWGRLAWNTRDGDAPTHLGLADELSAGLGLSLSRYRSYWPGTRAGASPVLALTYRNLGDLDFLGVSLAFRLSGTSRF